MAMKNLKRRHGQGMTEYIIIVGLIAMLLIWAITRYKNQVQITIEGSGDAIGREMSPLDHLGGGDGDGSSPMVTYTPTGERHNGSTVYTGSDGNRYINSGGTYTRIP